MIQHIKQLSKAYFNEVLAIRRHLHQHPELSFEEHQTSAYIQAQLSQKKIPFEHIAGTGIIATIPGKSKEAVCLRAELDALPIQENTKVSYSSLRTGMMHACGHDVHMAALLGAAFILKELESTLPHTIKILFQPAEEKLPGGATLVIAEGVLEKHHIKKMIAQHVDPAIEVGKLGFKPGVYMASCDELYVQVIGQGGHAALKESYINPLLIASAFLQQVEGLVNTSVHNPVPSVLSFGKIHSEGGATNIIPNKVLLEGTFRTFDEEFRGAIHAKIQELATQVAQEYKAEIVVDVREGYPFLYNNETLTKTAIQAATQYLGKEHILELGHRMTSEDFAYYSHLLPVCFYRLGVQNKQQGITASVHTPNFNIDESALSLAAGYMAYLALQANND